MTHILDIDYDLEVAREKIKGLVVFDKFGRNLDVDTGTAPEDVWNGGGLYTGFPTGTAETLEIASGNTNDTAAGTGARTVTITNLQDGNGNVMSDVTVSLNGTSQVSLGTQTYSRCTRMIVTSAGTSENNEGELTLRHTTTTSNIFAVMPALAGQTAICAYSVPAGKSLYLDYLDISMARAGGLVGSANVSFRARPLGQVFQSKVTPTITESKGYSYGGKYAKFAARTDLVVRVDGVSDNNTIVSGEFGGFLEDD